MKKKHFNIPIFIPELACPFQCIYCNQCKISGTLKMPSDHEILTTVNKYLGTIPAEGEVQLAYFGGNFTGIPAPRQEHYLKLIEPYVKKGLIRGIRISTRPDYIDDTVLALLKKHQVESIELGAQSMDDEVLKTSVRGHTAMDTVIASKKIRAYGFSLGLQMMIGLPGDRFEKSIDSAIRIAELEADDTRVYPTLVIKDTLLEKMYNNGSYRPLELEEAVGWAKEILLIFEKAGVKVLKMGLHPSEGLLSGNDLVAGPFHRSFRELVESQVWEDQLTPLKSRQGQSIEITVPPGQVNFAVGYAGKNKKMLLNSFRQVTFKTSGILSGRSFDFKLIN